MHERYNVAVTTGVHAWERPCVGLVILGKSCLSVHRTKDQKKQYSYPVLLRYYKKIWKHVFHLLIPSILENHFRLQPSIVMYQPLQLFQALPKSVL